MAQAYCMKCKKKVDVKNPVKVVTKNGVTAIKGTCSICGTKVFAMLGKKA